MTQRDTDSDIDKEKNRNLREWYDDQQKDKKKIDKRKKQNKKTATALKTSKRTETDYDRQTNTATAATHPNLALPVIQRYFRRVSVAKEGGLSVARGGRWVMQARVRVGVEGGGIRGIGGRFPLPLPLFACAGDLRDVN